jgi:glc operon protein GlcG
MRDPSTERPLVRSLRALDLGGATIVANAALSRAREIGIHVSICVVDPGGRLLVCLSDPDASRASVDTCQLKAQSAAGFRRPTLELGNSFLERLPVLIGLSKSPHVSLLGGGVPVVVDGQVIGGVGIGGGKQEEDVDCCKAGIAALLDALRADGS